MIASFPVVLSKSNLNKVMKVYETSPTNRWIKHTEEKTYWRSLCWNRFNPPTQRHVPDSKHTLMVEHRYSRHWILILNTTE